MTDLRATQSSQSHGPLARFKAGAYVMVLVMCAYIGSATVPEGWLTYVLSVIPCAILIITALARVNDLSIDMASTAWNVRRAGLILTALYAVTQLTLPLFSAEWPSWGTVIGLWGFALVWLTSPHQPPWMRYVWKGPNACPNPHPHRRKEDDLDANP